MVRLVVRGLGLATRLLETSFQFACEKGYQTISLFTTNTNIAARRIYQKVGMTLVHEEHELFTGQQQVGEIWEIDVAKLPISRNNT